jgi:hypothetical protein
MIFWNEPPKRSEAATDKQINNPEVTKVEVANPQAESLPAKPQPAKVKKTPKKVVKPKPKPVTYVMGTSEAQQFIFAHESSNNPHAINASSGACGLGQAWPCSKLLNVCGTLSNVDCQIKFFNTYAIERYGSWQGAVNFWKANNWW